jgi:hypothetical protein
MIFIAYSGERHHNRTYTVQITTLEAIKLGVGDALEKVDSGRREDIPKTGDEISLKPLFDKLDAATLKAYRLDSIVDEINKIARIYKPEEPKP